MIIKKKKNNKEPLAVGRVTIYPLQKNCGYIRNMLIQ